MIISQEIDEPLLVPDLVNNGKQNRISSFHERRNEIGVETKS